ncbi:low-specificity L-threonine aldolase [Acanthopleuribacter pedis]|uniref:Low-specificity L-threonine aldolase n=1 Tax=Acanthopleuribacter pedis TaxID=442870 RepID=A0A8J7QNV6_9BACT|nr:low-specificity L-threonine aldolase [Acanthopleuribacter pedis]MBO1321893.1 low-specificity L-threonine aldolase [Acanthopleuribacter pedis]
MNIIDLRSDTVTRPTEAMRAAMAAAEVGDDVYGDDPTVLRLQHHLAELAGKEAGLFLPSGTQSNLTALMAHCGRGDEALVGAKAHAYWYEGGGMAVLGSIQPQPVAQHADGTLDLALAEKLVKPDDVHHGVTKLLCLENTWFGRVMPEAYPDQARAFCDRHGLGLHLDGARLFNAAVQQKRPLADLTAAFDSVSLCLSKGLGAPVGSVLVGSKDLIKRAHRWRKVLGGGMRQAGVLAAAGLHALAHHVDRLAEDHHHAELLAEGLGRLPGMTVDTVATNMVFVRPAPAEPGRLQRFMRERGILIGESNPLRLVLHLDIQRGDIEPVIAAFAAFQQSQQG